MLLLLAVAAGYGLVVDGSLLRGFALWVMLLLALCVREVARGIAAAYAGLSVRGLILLPIGGVMALAPRGHNVGRGSTPQAARGLALSGTLANFAAALALLGFAYGIDPHVALFAQPWISTEHILRSAVWSQVVVGAVNLLPPTAMPTGRLLRLPGNLKKDGPAAGSSAPFRPRFTLTSAFALAFLLVGMYFGMVWPVALGAALLLTTFLNRAANVASVEGHSLTVHDVMLTEFRPLSASGTLRDALEQSTHSLQDFFPVLRGDRLVGWISRAALTTKLRLEGDSFLQGAMFRSLNVVDPGEKIADALRRASAQGAGEFVAVVQDGAMVGMITPRSLERAVGQLRLTRPAVERDA